MLLLLTSVCTPSLEISPPPGPKVVLDVFLCDDLPRNLLGITPRPRGGFWMGEFGNELPVLCGRGRAFCCSSIALAIWLMPKVSDCQREIVFECCIAEIAWGSRLVTRLRRAAPMEEGRLFTFWGFSPPGIFSVFRVCEILEFAIGNRMVLELWYN